MRRADDSLDASATGSLDSESSTGECVSFCSIFQLNSILTTIHGVPSYSRSCFHNVLKVSSFSVVPSLKSSVETAASPFPLSNHSVFRGSAHIHATAIFSLIWIIDFWLPGKARVCMAVLNSAKHLRNCLVFLLLFSFLT